MSNSIFGNIQGFNPNGFNTNYGTTVAPGAQSFSLPGPTNSGPGAVKSSPNTPNFIDDVTGGKFGSLASYGKMLEGISSLFGAYQGGKQLDQAEEQFDFQKGIFNRNLANQATLTNQRIGDQDTARRAATGASYSYAPRKTVDGSPV